MCCRLVVSGFQLFEQFGIEWHEKEKRVSPTSIFRILIRLLVLFQKAFIRIKCIHVP